MRSILISDSTRDDKWRRPCITNHLHCIQCPKAICGLGVCGVWMYSSTNCWSAAIFSVLNVQGCHGYEISHPCLYPQMHISYTLIHWIFIKLSWYQYCLLMTGFAYLGPWARHSRGATTVLQWKGLRALQADNFLTSHLLDICGTWTELIIIIIIIILYYAKWQHRHTRKISLRTKMHSYVKKLKTKHT